MSSSVSSTQASKRGLRLILTLTNYWDDYGGVLAYVKWAKAAGEDVHRREDFFTNHRCKNWYREYVARVVTRRNTLTGELYADDPAIFSYQLANEPRFQGDQTGDVLQVRRSESSPKII